MVRAVSVSCLAAVLLAGAYGRIAAAHHSFEAEFDTKQPVTLTGAVTRVDWINPHVWIHLDVKGPDGKVVSWIVEAAGPQVLSVRGWRPDSLRPGSVVTIQGFLARNGTPKANGRDVTRSDGGMLCANIPCRCCRFEY